ncbi:MAG: BatA domain-containing protein [Verrucomicrobia bacterium]|nr:BatA domain-containing protein [Verrucomicrobiota bacterium]
MSPISFLNPLMLAGLAAIAAPIILHLLNRQRFRVVPWGAMMFLRQSLAKARRRLRFQHLLLMLIRILILAFLALALARPLVKTAFTAYLGHSRTDLVLVLDSSFSTAYAAGETSDFENIRRTALSLIDTLRQGDTVSVIVASDTARPLSTDPSFELQRTKQAIAQLQPQPRAANFLRAADEIAALLPKLRNPNHEIYFITDGAVRGWGTDRTGDWERVAGVFAKRQPRPTVRVLAVAAAERPNVAVVDLNVQPRIVAASSTARITARVANHGSAARDISATLSIDGVQKAAKDAHVEGGDSSTVTFNIQFPEPGPHRVSLDIGADALPLDNRHYLALDAVETLPVLIADGSPSPNAFRSGSGFLAAALQPSDESVVKPVVMDAHALVSTDLSRYRVLVLANVARVDRALAEKLEQFVVSGRGMLVAPGSLAEASDYNTALFQEGRYLLPAKLVSVLRAQANTPNRVAANATWRLELAELTQAQVQSWWRLNPGAGTFTLATLANGDPLLISRRLGDGRVLQTALPLDNSWSDLPIHPVFVPLVHEMIYELAIPTQASRNLSVGDPPPARGIKTDEPGVFTAAGRALAINLDPTESDLSSLSATQRDSIGRWLGATFPENWRELPSRISNERFGMQLWRELVALALLLAVVETLLTSLWSARRTFGEAAAPKMVMNR